jgi:hypothetical protein
MFLCNVHSKLNKKVIFLQKLWNMKMLGSNFLKFAHFDHFVILIVFNGILQHYSKTQNATKHYLTASESRENQARGQKNSMIPKTAIELADKK